MGDHSTEPWSDFRRRGTLALGLLALLFPIISLIWARVVWQWSGDEVLLWIGDRAGGDLPRLIPVPKADLGVDYYWYAIAAEDAATRWWTSVVAVIGGVLLLMTELLPRARKREWREWAPWTITAMGLILVGLDERFQLHELARNKIFAPSGLTDGVGFINPGDIATLIYPIGGAALWWLLFRTAGTDRLSRGLLIAVIPIGALSIGIDVLTIEALDRYPGWVYGGLVEEFGEWGVVALMAIVAWRRLSHKLAAIRT
jgi:hypothetical protein